MSQAVRLTSVLALTALAAACGGEPTEAQAEAAPPAVSDAPAVDPGQVTQDVSVVCPQCVSYGDFWSVNAGWANGYACAPYYPTQYYTVRIFLQNRNGGWDPIGTGTAQQYQSSIFSICGGAAPHSYYHGFGVPVSYSGPGYYKMEAFNPNGTSFGVVKYLRK
jgi:hypothetical protein